MSLTLRVDLDYVPWDTPDAAEFGHGEPANLLRILEMGRHTGYRFHFFASNRVLRAFPMNAEAVLNDGHDLDWICKHPEAADRRFADALKLFESVGHVAIGLAVRGAWPSEAPDFAGIDTLRFLSAAPGAIPGKLRLFPVESRPMRDLSRSGVSARSWTDMTKSQLRDTASRNVGLTVVVRPQVLARFDPQLVHLRELLDFASALDVPVRTLRERLG
jgi:hypothetical protein